jgi:putative transposase
MAKATKTIKQALLYQPQHTAWFAQTQALFNHVVAFYFEEVLAAHPGILELSDKEALTALERLTHTTRENPHPLVPLSAIAENLPAVFRRAAIHAALGSARSFHTQLARWRMRKEQAQVRGKKCTIRPPLPPRQWNRSVILYAGMYKNHQGSGIMLKLWTGGSWAWVKCRVQGRDLPEGWDGESPALVFRQGHWWLHTPVKKRFASPGSVKEQMSHPGMTICAVDLNLDTHLAVCTIQTVEGTVLATRFIGGNAQVHGLRKRLLGKIARNRGKTGILAVGEQDNVRLWAKVRHLDEQTAHLVSHHIVAFAQAHGATILTFEHLGNLKPEKGRYSRSANSKRMYWLKGRIFAHSKYKAWNTRGIITCRVSPRNTSRECARCGAPVARYAANQPVEGYTPGAPLVYCPACGMRGHADRNASIVIGQRLIMKYRSQEKPHAPLAPERPVKAGGVAGSQDAESKGRLSTDPAGHGASNEQGTAQDTSTGMAEGVSGIPRQLRWLSE